MSRIIRPRVDPGDVTDATTLNNTYDDYSQSGALDQYNTRDQAFGIPHLAPDVKLIKNTDSVILGTGAANHGSTPVVVNALAAGSAVHPIVDAPAGAETPLNLGTGWTINSGECLRVWWNLSVQTTNLTGNPFWNTTPDALGLYSVENSLAIPANTQLSDGFHCWLAYIEWDITSLALTNFVPVPGQGPPTSSFGSYTGLRVADMNASTVISPWVLTSYSHGTEGKMPSSTQGERRDHGWYAPYGMYVHAPAAPVTVHGLRLVLVGILHPVHNGAGDKENILAFDYNLRLLDLSYPQLQYLSGRMSAVHMSMG